MTPRDRLEALRALMKDRAIEALYVPKADMYQGENIRPADERLAAVTGFTGSAGFAVVTPHGGAVFHDSRYTIQAKSEIAGTGLTPVLWPETRLEDWLANADKPPQSLTVDPLYIPETAINTLREKLEAAGIALTLVDKNPIDEIWQDRPEIITGAVTELSVALAGQSREAKIAWLDGFLAERELDGYLSTRPDDIAWMLNLRGADIPNTPVPLYSGIFRRGGTVELCGITPITQDIEGVTLTLAPEAKASNWIAGYEGRIGYDPDIIPAALARKIGDPYPVKDPITPKKAVKNAAEHQASIDAHQKDGLALCKFLAWVNRQEAETVTEISARDKLLEYRQESAFFGGNSFDTISGFGANGAIVHYRVDEASNRRFENNALYLVDSGGQYPGATTDITRTLAIGVPPAEASTPFTAVLEGLAHLSILRFPKGTTGRDIDIMARAPLWNLGLNYGHGTGHGVGAGLGVHEGPTSISKKSDTPLEAGMILSIEPGYYLEGQFGIRLENLVIVKEARDGFLYFETLSYAPIDKKIIQLALLSQRAIAWLDRYHAEVYKKYKDFADDGLRQWLKQACAPLLSDHLSRKP